VTRTIDFDAFRAEQKREAVDFVIDGVHYALPPALPASMAVDVIRMQSDLGEDAEVPNETMDIFGRSLFGATIWEKLLVEHRITVDELSPLLERVLEVYTDAPKETAEEPTSQTPELASV
jgi:hypothetical protein